MLTRNRLRALLIATCVGVTACAGSGSDRAAPEADGTAASVASAPGADADADAGTGAATGETSPVRRELGLALRPESDVATNLLPSVEVHDVGQDRMVNFKNIFPADTPVLLWMWAPY